MKISDLDTPLPVFADGAELRVLLPEDERYEVLAEKLSGAGAAVRQVRYLLEDETVIAPASARGADDLIAHARTCALARPSRPRLIDMDGDAAAAARDAFELMWQDLDTPVTIAQPRPAPAVPAELLGFLPFRTFNPAQTEALPEIFEHDDHLVVVAPTGAGKTVIGMAAALRSIIQQRRKAAWLVPQRSLTDELDRELEGWRERGLRVQRLSGECAVDVAKIRDADLWVATTEKFEAICRAAAFREALAEVNTLVVDEIHMLGDPARGPILEALLSRVRDDRPTTRIVGLSATVANAEEIAGWLRGRLVRVGWRPSRLVWQLPTIPSHADHAVVEAARTRLATAITGLVTADGGSVLVFCGSKRNVRRTALVIAASRGMNTSRVHPDNVERLHEVCRQARVGLHYQGWEHRQEAEQAFRQREFDVLVATSTVAAGVNLPARAVVVQDTEIGLNPLDVATVQQMFGRAGRVGAGERQGWAFLIVDGRERMLWQSRLVAGHAVRSQILSNLAEQVLSEVVQHRIGSDQEASQWWAQTLAFHQGRHEVRPLTQAVAFLASAGMLTRTREESGTRRLAATELGKLTTRLMVSPVTCDNLRQALAEVPVPADPAAAEGVLIATLTALVPKFAQVTAGDEIRTSVGRLLAVHGDPCAADAGHVGPATGPQPGDLARAALLAVSASPEAFHRGVRTIGGIPYSAMYPVLEEAPRYLHWIASQGLFGTVHPWCAIVAADLERRIRWRYLQPPRGSGRLLWACEQMATPAHVDELVPQLWAAARAGGHHSPDWATVGRPRQCRLDRAAYLALLRDRATGVTVKARPGQVRARGPAGSALVTWTGSSWRMVPIRNGEATADEPSGGTGIATGIAAFTWRGDYRGSGWLSAYSRLP